MARFLLLSILLWLVWRSLERIVGGAPRQRVTSKPTRAEGPVEKLVACVECGVYYPASRMLLRSGESFCSEECRGGRPAEAS